MIYMVDGGKLRIKNVVFDGDNYVSNTESSFWTISGDTTEVVVENSIFRNNKGMMEFANGSHTTFRNCTFENNEVNTSHAVSSNHHLAPIELALDLSLDNLLCDNSSWVTTSGTWV